MITGSVTPFRTAVIPLLIKGPNGQEKEVDATLDTGFTAHLALTPEIVAELGLPFGGTTEATVADGRLVEFNVYAATVLWDGRPRDVPVWETKGGCLVGMSMLYGSLLTLYVADGGNLMIEVLP